MSGVRYVGGMSAAVATDARATVMVGGGQGLKRVMDVAGASVLILVFLPLMVIVALIVRSDGGPAIFRHMRVGRDGRPFPCLKFRSMAVDADRRLADLLATDPAAKAQWERDFKLNPDPRVTRIGRFLRKSSLDELPQLLNILRGEMSLVGPRPIIEAEVPRYGRYIAHYLECRPGLTGLWQISGRSDVSYRQRVALDTVYARHQSVWLDCVILLRTVVVVLVQRGAV